MKDLAETLQRLYDSEINVTITWLWHGGIDFALMSPMNGTNRARAKNAITSTVRNSLQTPPTKRQ